MHDLLKSMTYNFVSILASFSGGTLSLEFVKPNFSNDIFHRNSNFPTSKFLKYNS